MGETGTTRTLIIRESVLDKNRAIAGANRARFDRWGCLALNVLSSPGAGKTALLERTLTDIASRLPLAVIVGDLATDNDGRRLGNRGAPIIQITTGDICHLDAAMISRACDSLDAEPPEVCFIENVGNMVCPAAFDLGEHARVALLSVTEGEDKPSKYPTLFSTADLVLITKTDIADAVGFDRQLALGSIRSASPNCRVIEVSSRTGAGLDEWYAWIAETRAARPRGSTG
ncbi:MAG: hydrogenase nickel incorporation protein HypB [Armatimonadetes bacterium]|nr:hydrogenase nickel incorporation protein HypB [Armatimonadota bacterium]